MLWVCRTHVRVRTVSICYSHVGVANRTPRSTWSPSSLCQSKTRMDHPSAAESLKTRPLPSMTMALLCLTKTYTCRYRTTRCLVRLKQDVMWVTSFAKSIPRTMKIGYVIVPFAKYRTHAALEKLCRTLSESAEATCHSNDIYIVFCNRLGTFKVAT